LSSHLHQFLNIVQDMAKGKARLGGELVEEPVARTPPHLEPIVPNSGNRLRIKSFT
jgi:hypothetical protein